uniref:Mitochondrial carrier protein n=1 Tax=Timema douglasi TaxID=61478 RepID=A0A7R8VEU8_TIMDO|nr:unnamed protein product [Timema douglasi]
MVGLLLQYLDTGQNMDKNVPDGVPQSQKLTGMWWRHLVSGGVAGAVSATCTAPLDRIKVYMQVRKTLNSLMLNKKRSHVFKVQGTKNTSIKNCWTHLLKEGGIWSFWRGNGMNVIKIAPENAIKFMAYEQAKRMIMGNQKRDLPIHERFVAGSLAGAISQTVIYPLEVMKTRLALRKTGQYKNLVDAVRKMYETEGIRGYYRGYVPNIFRTIPNAGINLAVYETLKNTYLRQQGDKNEKSSVLLPLLCGSTSSTCAQVCTYPFALVATRLQAQVTTPGQTGGTMTRMMRQIWKAEGFSGFYRGLTPSLMRTVPAISIGYLIYERCREALGVRMA